MEDDDDDDNRRCSMSVRNALVTVKKTVEVPL